MMFNDVPDADSHEISHKYKISDLEEELTCNVMKVALFESTDSSGLADTIKSEICGFLEEKNIEGLEDYEVGVEIEEDLLKANVKMNYPEGMVIVNISVSQSGVGTSTLILPA